MTERFLVWSEEHGRWWKPARNGYTSHVAEAGRYSREQAEDIVRDGNFSAFHEVAFPVPEDLDKLLGRAKPDPVTNVDERARELEAAVNAKLAELPPTATEGEVMAVINEMVPDGWEWVEATSVTGPRTIHFTRYGLA